MRFRLRIIGLLLLVTATIGCGVLFNVNRVMRLDPVILTEDDLPMMRLEESVRSRGNLGIPAFVGFDQWWSGGLTVRYWLFDFAYTAKQGVDMLRGTIAAGLFFEPESNAEDIIGDATWCHVKSGEKSIPILFVKSNVVVLVHPRAGPGYTSSLHQLQFARDIARKVEVKITTVLEKE